MTALRHLPAKLAVIAVLASLVAAPAMAQQNHPWGHRKERSQTVDGACGASAGQRLSAIPTTDLCDAGTASNVSSRHNHYRWSCKGTHGGSTAECRAKVNQSATTTPVNGACGSANGQTLSTAPTTNLCTTTSTASTVTGAGPWSWSCAGTNGGTAAPCTASLQATTTTTSCGTHTSGSTYTLTTSSTNGTTAATTAQCPNGGTVPTLTVVTQQYTCANGVQTAKGSPISTTTNAAAVCNSSGGGQVCPALAKLCPDGSSVSATGPNCTFPACPSAGSSCGTYASGTTWTTTVTVTGTTAATAAQCPAGGTVPTSTTTTTTYACTNGTQSVSGTPTSSTTVTGSPTCAAAASCGAYLSGSTYTLVTSSTTGSTAATTAQCPNGGTVPTLTTVTQNYTCTNGKQTANGAPSTTTTSAGQPSCTAAAVNGACGTSNAQVFTTAPKTNLCSTGTASAVSGSGPWTWSCTGTHGGTTASCTGAITTASTGGGTGSGGGSTTSNSGVRAVTDFINNIGVNSAITFQDTPYYNKPQSLITAVQYLGINTLRDQVPDMIQSDDPASYAEYGALAAAGVHFNLLMLGNGPIDLTTAHTNIDAFVTAHPGAVTSLEGPNEINQWPISYGGYSLGQYAQAGRQFTQDYWALVQADPLLKNIPVYLLTESLGPGMDPLLADMKTLGNLSSYVTYGNVHIYASGSNNLWEFDVPYWLQALKMAAPTMPTVMTETGYSTITTGNQDGTVDETSAAKYNLNTLFDNAVNGIVKTYLYELVDGNSATSNTDTEMHYGQFHSDWTPKVGATALHNLTTILSNAGNGTATSTLNYSITGLPSQSSGSSDPDPVGNSYLLGSSTMFDLVVWVDATVWNSTNSSAISTPSYTAKVNLGATYPSVSVYDPMVGTTPTATYSNVSSVSISVVDHPIIVQVTTGTATTTPTSSAASCTGGYLSGTTYTLQTSQTTGTGTATAAQCPNGGTVPTLTVTTQTYTCTNGVQTAQGSPKTSTTSAGPAVCTATGATCATTATGTSTTFDPNDPAASGYQLTFDDEFNGYALDTTKWTPSWAWGDGINSTYPNDEPVAKNIVLNNNNIAQFILSVGGTSTGAPYANGIATTYGKFSQQYGYWEARIQMPAASADGMWDAFWLVPTDFSWPPEIDIIEWLGNEPTVDWMTNHYGSTDHANGGSYSGPDLSMGFHVMGVLWTPNSIIWYLDGVQRFISTVGVPAQPMYAIIDNNSGGWNGNAVDASTSFPTVMSVNWVHVWGLPCGGPV